MSPDFVVGERQHHQLSSHDPLGPSFSVAVLRVVLAHPADPDAVVVAREVRAGAGVAAPVIPAAPHPRIVVASMACHPQPPVQVVATRRPASYPGVQGVGRLWMRSPPCPARGLSR